VYRHIIIIAGYLLRRQQHQEFWGESVFNAMPLDIVTMVLAPTVVVLQNTKSLLLFVKLAPTVVVLQNTKSLLLFVKRIMRLSVQPYIQQYIQNSSNTKERKLW
jgi:uncharacterized membrane protein